MVPSYKVKHALLRTALLPDTRMRHQSQLHWILDVFLNVK